MRKQSKVSVKLFALIAALAMIIFSWTPVYAGVMRLMAADSPDYNPNQYSFTAPVQSTPPFSSQAMTVQNGDFSASTTEVFSSQYATGWTYTGQNAITGTLNTRSFDDFTSANFKDSKNIPFLQVNPLSATANSNVLVLANSTATATASASYSQSLPAFYANGFFQVSVDFYAVGIDAKPSSIYLTPGTDFGESTRPIPAVALYQASSDNSSNTSTWQTATFYVKTDLLESVNFTLSLNLGQRGGVAGSGVVYYDNINVTEYSAKVFEPLWDTAVVNQYAYQHSELPTGETASTAQKRSGQNTCLVDLTKPYSSTTPADKIAVDPGNPTLYDESFTSAKDTKFSPAGNGQTAGVQIRPYIATYDIAPTLNFQTVTQVYGTALPGDSGALLLSAVNARAGVRYKSPLADKSYSFTFDAHAIYMINFYTLGASSAYFRLYDTRFGTDLPDYITPYDSGYVTLGAAADSSAPSHNNWILNTIFVTGTALVDTNTYNFEFWVGNADAATGYLLVDDFSIVKVSQSYHDRHSSDTNAMDLKLDSLQDSADINNAFFNAGTIRSVTAPYPLIASNWTVFAEGNAVSDQTAFPSIIDGIVNTDTNHWNNNNVTISNGGSVGGKAYGAAQNPGSITYRDQTGSSLVNSNNNIFMMQNMQPTSQRVASNSFSLAADSNNTISFYAATLGLTNTEVWAVLEMNGHEVTRLRLLNPDLGANLSSDKIASAQPWRNYSISVQTSKFSGPSCTISFLLGDMSNKTTGCLFIDNIQIAQNLTSAADTSVDLSDPSKLYLKSTGSTTSDQGGDSLFFAPTTSGTATAHFDTSNNVLAIQTVGASHAVVENSMTEPLTTDKWYKYTVTVSSAAVDIDQTYYDNDEKPDWGLSLRLKGMTGGYEYLQNADIESMPHDLKLIGGNYVNCFDFTFVIKPSSSFDMALSIEFGSDGQDVVGSIGIVATSLTEIDESTFNAFKGNDYVRMITDGTSESNSGTNDTKPININWLVVPTIIMSVAIIVAVGGTLIRRTRFKRHIGQAHTSYARDDKSPIQKTPTAKRARKVIDD